MYALIVIYLLTQPTAEVHLSKKVFIFPDAATCQSARNYWLPHQQGVEDGQKSGTQVLMDCSPVEPAPGTTTGT
jgi:hypothetical protein